MKNFKRASRVFRGRRGELTSRAVAAAVALALLSAPATSEPAALATQRLQARNATPNEAANGTMSPAARAAMERGPLPMSEAAVAAKAAANRVRDAAEKAAPNPLAPTESSLPGESLAGGPRVPAVVGGLNFAGQAPSQAGASFAQPDPTGAIGPMSYIQLTNDGAGIFNRTTGAPLASGTLNWPAPMG